jgi:hypothetical protein
MLKTTYVAAKDLQIEDKRVKKGDPLFSIESDHPVERMFASIGNGAAIPEDDHAKSLQQAAEKAKQAAAVAADVAQKAQAAATKKPDHAK